MTLKLRYAAIVAVIGLLAVGWIAWSDRGDRDANVSLRLAWLPGATFLGDYVALEKGYWADRGLKVAMEPGGFEFDAIKLVAAGSNTFGVASGPQILQARAAGVPVVAIGSTIPRSPIGWVAKASSGITEPRDFVGQKVGAQFGTHTELTFEALMKKLGIPLDDVDRVPVKFDPRPFIVGDIDVLPVYIIDQPYELEAQGIELNIIDPGDYGVSLAYGNVYFTTEQVVAEQPDMVRDFVAGAREGWQEAHRSPGEARNHLEKHMTDPDSAVLEKKIFGMFQFIMKQQTEYLGIFPIEADELLATHEMLAAYDQITAQVDVSNSFDNSFLSE